MSDPWSTVAALGSAIRYGGSSLSDVPVLVIKVVEGDLWMKFRSPAGEEEHRSFEDFVKKPNPGGLGTTISMLQNLCRTNKAALAAIEKATDRSAGGDRRSESYQKNIVDNIHNERPSGTSESAALRRLRKDRPDLLAQVLNNEISSNAAAIKAGFRPKKFTVRADKPESIVATLRRQLDPETLAMVTKLLSEESA